MEKTWRCTVCGYLHTGEHPPEVCPVCKADASKFELVDESEADAADQPEGKVDKLKAEALAFLKEMQGAFVPHAVAAHFPNALLPTLVLFLLLFILTGQISFETTSFYLLIVVLLAVPPTLVTGVLDWKKEYAGELTPIFRKKIILALTLFVLGSLAVVWRLFSPDVLSSGGFSACVYSILLFVLLGCVTLLGHYGGMLVFAKRK